MRNDTTLHRIDDHDYAGMLRQLTGLPDWEEYGEVVAPKPALADAVFAFRSAAIEEMKDLHEARVIVFGSNIELHAYTADPETGEAIAASYVGMPDSWGAELDLLEPEEGYASFVNHENIHEAQVMAPAF